MADIGWKGKIIRNLIIEYQKEKNPKSNFMSQDILHVDNPQWFLQCEILKVYYWACGGS